MTTTTTTISTTTLFTSASAKGYTPVRGIKGVCARIRCCAEGCTEMAFIFRNNDGKVINACTCGWRRVAPPVKKWGKPVSKTPRVNEEVEAAFALKKAAALAATALRVERLREESAQDAKDNIGTKSLELLDEQINKDMSEFKPDMS